MRVLALLLLLATPAAGQEAVPITPDALLDRLVGGSAVFTVEPGGAPVGVEYFPSRTRSFWRQEGGRCTTGTMTVTEGQLCFRYEDQPAIAHCWLPFERDGALFYRATGTDHVQRIAPVPGLPFDCVDGLTS